MVFQNTLSALNPRQRIGNILEDILKIHSNLDAAERREKVVEVLKKVGLLRRPLFPFSARTFRWAGTASWYCRSALVIGPKLIVCDEPVSALDVSIQGTDPEYADAASGRNWDSAFYLFHTISVLSVLSSDRIGVMYLGTLVEETDTEELFANPLHPYTKGLLLLCRIRILSGTDFQSFPEKTAGQNRRF